MRRHYRVLAPFLLPDGRKFTRGEYVTTDARLWSTLARCQSVVELQGEPEAPFDPDQAELEILEELSHRKLMAVCEARGVQLPAGRRTKVHLVEAILRHTLAERGVAVSPDADGPALWALVRGEAS